MMTEIKNAVESTKYNSHATVCAAVAFTCVDLPSTRWPSVSYRILTELCTPVDECLLYNLTKF